MGGRGRGGSGGRGGTRGRKARLPPQHPVPSHPPHPLAPPPAPQKRQTAPRASPAPAPPARQPGEGGWAGGLCVGVHGWGRHNQPANTRPSRPGLPPPPPPPAPPPPPPRGTAAHLPLLKRVQSGAGSHLALARQLHPAWGGGHDQGARAALVGQVHTHTSPPTSVLTSRCTHMQMHARDQPPAHLPSSTRSTLPSTRAPAGKAAAGSATYPSDSWFRLRMRVGGQAGGWGGGRVGRWAGNGQTCE